MLHACSWSCTGARNWVNSRDAVIPWQVMVAASKCPVRIRRDSNVWTGALNFDGDNQFRAHVTVSCVVPSTAQIILFLIIPASCPISGFCLRKKRNFLNSALKIIGILVGCRCFQTFSGSIHVERREACRIQYCAFSLQQHCSATERAHAEEPD